MLLISIGAFLVKYHYYSCIKTDCHSMNVNEFVYDIGNNMRQAPSPCKPSLRSVRQCLHRHDATPFAHIVTSPCFDSTPMGKKSDKKVKSERVNALRKQYDAFLEEDKKRKERNEYILGRLDNMRYSSTAVQIRHKPIVYGDVMPIYNRGPYRPDLFDRQDFQKTDAEVQVNHPSHQNLQLDVPRNYLDNASLLKEISKKYILIPKLRSTLVNDYNGTIPPQSLPSIAISLPQSNATGNEDWKSKYDILEQLKNKEKEESTSKYASDELYPVKDKQTPSKANTTIVDNFSPNQDIQGFKPLGEGDVFILQNQGTKEFTTKYEVVAGKDLTLDKVRVDSEPQNIERLKINESKDHEPTTEQALNISASTFTDVKPDTTHSDYKLQHFENYAPVEILASNVEQNVYGIYPNEDLVATKYHNEENVDNSDHQINDVLREEENPIQNNQPVEIEGKFPDSENAYLDPDDYSPIQVLEPSAVVEQSHIEGTENDTTDIKEDEVVEYHEEMLNVQEFTPKDDVKLIDGENVNPIYLSSEHNVELEYESNLETKTVDESSAQPQEHSGIEAFDAEQAGMFYSEETSDYAYEKQEQNTYDQDYENTQTQDYTYYESPATALQEEYPAEINEHEESSARYDQNYEQQYATEYEQQQYQGQEEQQYDQPEGYDQTEQQQYIQPEGYEQTEQQQYVGYDQTEQQYQDYEYQPEQDTVQTVQQDLDNEAGYVDQQNSEATKVETQMDPAYQAVDEKTA